MARTLSTMLELGTVAPSFHLLNSNSRISDEYVSLDQFGDKRALLVAFICNHCPYVIHIRNGFSAFAREYLDKGLQTVAISANDVSTHPDDGPQKMKIEAETHGYVFPYLYDESQSVAKEYRAACTPDFFLFDSERKLVYRGQFDGARPGNDVAVTGADLRTAVDAILKGKPVPEKQIASMGCNIKWKSGNEPDY